MALRRPHRVERRARVISAAGERLRPGDTDQMRKLRLRRQQWQEEAWGYYDEIGEIKYAVSFKANAISKARLYVGLIIDPEKPPVDLDSDEAKEAGIDDQFVADAQAQLERLQAPIGGQAEILRMEAANFDVAGEFYLIGLAPRPGKNEEEDWDIYSVDEIRASGTDLQIVKPGEQTGRKLTDDDFAARMWRRHPRSRDIPDSGLRGVLSSCEGLLILDRTIRAIAKSRATSGFLLKPDELSFGNADPTTDDAEDSDEGDPFHEELVKALTTPVLDEGSAAAVVPMVITGKAEYLKEFRWLVSERKIDADLLNARDKELTRIGQGLDLPVEFMTGMAQANHWTAWLIDDSLFRAHLEPVLVALCDFKTQVFLRPGLVDAGHGQDPMLDQIVVWYDATPLITRTNVQEDAKQLHDKMAISDGALRATTGFDESDAPDEGEITRRLVQHQRTWDPTLIRYMLELALGPEFDPPPPMQNGVPLPGEGSAEEEGQEPIGGAERRAAQAPPPTDTKPGGPSSGETPPLAPMAARMMEFVEMLAPGFGEDVIVEALKRRFDPAKLQRVLTAASTNGAHTNGHAKPARLGEHLGRIDRTLMHRMMGAADAAMRRAIERAGAKLRSKPGMPKEVTASRSIPNVEVGSYLSPRLIRAAGYSDETDLLDGAFDDFGSTFDEMTRQAQDSALNAVAAEGSLSEEDIASIRASQERGRADAWDWLSGALTALGAERLYRLEPEAPPAGEFTPKMTVPPSMIREAMARAGGTTDLERTASGGLRIEAGARPAGGVGLGDTIRGALNAAGFEEQGWTWQHDDPPVDFMPHVDLDQLEFTSWDDPVLEMTDEGAWIGEPFYYPGDHEGCRCMAIPIMVLRVPGDEETGDGSDEEQAAAAEAAAGE